MEFGAYADDVLFFVLGFYFTGNVFPIINPQMVEIRPHFKINIPTLRLLLNHRLNPVLRPLIYGHKHHIKTLIKQRVLKQKVIRPYIPAKH